MNNPVNMADFIEAKSDQLNADDLLDKPRTITVTNVSANPDSAEQPVSIHFEGDNRKPFKPCKTMRRLIVAVWDADTSKYAGRSMTLYRDSSVQFGGMNVGGIRISHMSHIEKEQMVPLLVTRGRKKPFTVQPLKVEQRDDGLAAAIDKIIHNIGRAPSEAKLNAYLAGSPAGAINDARANRPDLAKMLDAAIAQKHSEWGDDDDPFSEQEGGASKEEQGEDAPPSDQVEDAEVGDLPAWHDAIEQIKTDIDAAEDEKALKAVEKEYDKHRAALPDEVVADLDMRFDVMRKALKRRAEG